MERVFFRFWRILVVFGFLCSCGGGNNLTEKACCGKVIFSIATDDGRATKITSCDMNESAEFCFQINNPRTVYFDNCEGSLSATYVVDYGDGVTEEVEPSQLFCHSFSPGGHMIKVTSYAYADGCYPVPYTKSYQIGVVPCASPQITGVVNSCCTSEPCEVVVGTCCDIGIQAKDPMSQPLTYCWDRDGNGDYEFCDSFNVARVCFRDVGRKIVGTKVENACGCQEEGRKVTVDVIAWVPQIPLGNISVALGVGDIYPRVISDTFYLYVSSTATTLNHPVLFLYASPLTLPFDLSLQTVLHGDARGFDIAFSDSGYLHLNGRSEGVYVYAATYPFVLTEVSRSDPSTRQGGWIYKNGNSMFPDFIYAEGNTGIALDNPVSYLVNLNYPPGNWKEIDRYYPTHPYIYDCPNVSDVFLLYPFAFVGRLMKTNPMCGVEIHDYSDSFFGSSYYENPPPLKVLRYNTCSDSSICELVDLKGKHGFLYENDYLGPATYSSPVTLTLFTGMDYSRIDVYASDGTSTVKLQDGVDYTLLDKKHLQISQSFYSSHPDYVYSATYFVPNLLVGGIKGGASRVLLWDVGNYPDILTAEKKPTSAPVGVDTFSDGIVVSCGEQRPSGTLDIIPLDVFDFRDPYNPVKLSTLDLMNTCKLHRCLDVKAFTLNDEKVVGVNTGFEVALIDLKDLSSPYCAKTFYFYGSLTDIHPYLSDYLVFTVEMGGIMIYNVSDYDSPYFVSSYQSGRIFDGLEIVGDKVFAITNVYNDQRTEKRSGKLSVIDISDLTYPRAVTVFATSNGANALTCIEEGDGNVYLAGGDYVGVVDISDPTHPVEVAWENLREDSSIYSAEDCTYDAGKFVVLTETGKIFVYSTVPALNLLNTFTPLYTGGFIKAVYLAGNLLYIGSRGYITIYDISNPQNPSLVANVYLGGSIYQINDFELVDNFLFAAVEDTTTGVNLGYGYIYDVTDPTSPLKYGRVSGYAFNRVAVKKDTPYYSIYLSAPKNNINVLMLYRGLLTY